MSNSASLPAEPFDHSSSEAPAWKQEVNQRLAAHRNRRGGVQESVDGQAAESARPANDRVAQVQARVAARYAKAPSYSEALAGEARAVVRAAGVAAQAARSAQAAAEAVLANLESGLESGLIGPKAGGSWEAAQQHAKPAVPVAPATPSRWQDEPPAAQAKPETQVKPRWEETLPVIAPPQVTVETTEHDVWAEMRVYPAGPYQPPTRPSVSDRHRDEGELFPFDEMDHRAGHDPLLSATVEPAQAIPANLIEFPKELVAPRKARPRLAEGPYHRAAEDSPQLSIFEVDPELLDPPICLNSPTAHPVAPPEWASIELQDHSEPAYSHHALVPAPVLSEASYTEPSYTSQSYAEAAYQENKYAEAAYAEAEYAGAEFDNYSSSAVAVGPAGFAPVEYAPSVAYPAQTEQVEASQAQAESYAQPRAQAEASSVELLVASVGDRAMAAVVDVSLVTLAYVAAAFVAMASMDNLPGARTALIASGIGIFLIGLLYQYLFLSFAEEGTPGMRYARIALCTFDDDNPTRSQMRKRIPAMLIAGLPLGIGLAWAMIDKEHVGWHDRWTKTYQRKY